MKLLPPILFLVAEYGSSGRYTLYVCRQNGDKTDGGEIPQNGGCIVAVVICGHGVITKPAGSDIARRVETDGDTFLSSRAGDTVSFFRRDRMPALESDLASRGIVPVARFCMAADADMPSVAAAYTERIRSSMNWRQLLRPADVSSAVLQAFARRIRIPVLVICLLSLAANAVISPALDAERERLRSSLAARERTDSRRTADYEREQALVGSFAVRRGTPRAVLCDRIAASVPEPVCLRSIEVEPPTVRFEAGKPLQRRENVAVVTGSAPSSEAVSRFVAALSQDPSFGSVVLSSMGRDRNDLTIDFRIDIEL